MNARTHTESSPGDAVDDIAALSVGLGMLTFVLFPLALPALLLAAVAVVPLLVLALVVALAAAVIAAPVLAVRAVRRRRNAGHGDEGERDRAGATAGLRAATSARGARS